MGLSPVKKVHAKFELFGINLYGRENALAETTFLLGFGLYAPEKKWFRLGQFFGTIK